MKTIRYDELRAGDMYRYPDDEADEISCCEADVAYDAPVQVDLVGRGKVIDIPGMSYTAVLFRGKLFVGCQQFSAVKAFKALGKALGYEVTG